MIKQSFSDNVVDFLKDCTVFYPFKISHILTTNGLVFTDKFLIKDKQISGNHKFDKLYSLGEMKHDSAKFLLFYHYAHPHGEVRKEVKVRTSCKALEYWFNLKPDLFIREPPCMFQEMVFEKG